jgi:hypothetical protein
MSSIELLLRDGQRWSTVDGEGCDGLVMEPSCAGMVARTQTDWRRQGRDSMVGEMGTG